MELWNLDYFDDTKDIIAEVNGKRYELNSIILFISDMMREIFIGTRFLESENEIKEIVDISTETWELFLNYIYTIYIRGYLRVLSSDMELLALSQINAYQLLDLIVFADKIIAPRLVYDISKRLFTNNLDYILNKLENEEKYSEYEDILSYIDPNVILINNYSYRKTPVYDTNTHKWLFDFDKIAQYPHLLYYILVSISRYDVSTTKYIEKNITFKIDYIYKDGPINEEIVDKIMSKLSIIKPVKPRPKYDNNDNKNNIRYLNDCMYKIMRYVLYDITYKYYQVFSVLIDDDWRIKGDDLVHNLILDHFI